jgi:hypothetical protein
VGASPGSCTHTAHGRWGFGSLRREVAVTPIPAVPPFTACRCRRDRRLCRASPSAVAGGRRVSFSKARLTSPFATPILTLDRRMKRRAPACRRGATLWFRRIRRKTCVRRMLPRSACEHSESDDAAQSVKPADAAQVVAAVFRSAISAIRRETRLVSLPSACLPAAAIKGCGFRYFVPRYGWYELVNHSASWTVWKWPAVPAHVHPTTKRLRGR